ncbi:SHOCT domain-containing protein [Microbacterium halophytorum]|uniref:SHOCT domain-containing protein n=1 Tax=Microbacterium halophytorum TaxID=2067568 RepID=UPI000CFC423C|nr:SHOCT domain-containing protein [Microbacterium halophytorum]
MSFWETFWSVIGWMFWFTIFVAYLMALFSILGDIFRDKALKGWAKAVWVIFLIFIPFLTALVYLIARGNGMGERSAAAYAESKKQADEYIRHVAHTDPATQIEKASQLLASGSISQAEFEQLKARALAG